MKTPVTIGTMVLALSLLCGGVTPVQGAQEPNPLFLDASDFADQLESSALDDNVKKAWAQRFQDLKHTQQQLWDLAGQVDGGQCNESCIDLYNSRVETWQNNLQRFIDDARSTLKALKSDPEYKFKCWGECDKDHTACWKDCLDGPIEENDSCHRACDEVKIKCTNDC